MFPIGQLSNSVWAISVLMENPVAWQAHVGSKTFKHNLGEDPISLLPSEQFSAEPIL